ncbi:MAG: 4Fe-4S dicluster domain-containing protein [Clostridia bacterium]|nr:4Fe-4S dicluster domain-containing protein [Clostridia bacterium]
MKRVYANEKLCINCRVCEVYCRAAHSKSADVVRAYKEEPESCSRIHVEGDNNASIAVSCRHCENPACVEACITGAMQKDPKTGLVINDPARCVGCMTCALACPYGCIKIGHIAQKCDLCGLSGEPECVRHCPNNALIYAQGGSEK